MAIIILFIMGTFYDNSIQFKYVLESHMVESLECSLESLMHKDLFYSADEWTSEIFMYDDNMLIQCVEHHTEQDTYSIPWPSMETPYQEVASLVDYMHV